MRVIGSTFWVWKNAGIHTWSRTPPDTDSTRTLVCATAGTARSRTRIEHKIFIG